MNKIAKIIVMCILCFNFMMHPPFQLQLFCINPEDCKVSYKIYGIDGDKFEGKLIFVPPSGWKIPKSPKITIAIQNPQKFHIKFDVNGEPETQQGAFGTEYAIPFQLELIMDDIAEEDASENIAYKPKPESDLKVKILADIALCSDVCTIVSKEIVIDCGNAAKKHNLPTKKTSQNSSSQQHLWTMMLLGFWGGLLLNLMPCVLPVILLKMRSFLAPYSSNVLADSGRSSATSVKRLAVLGTILGNYASFAVFALSLILLKAAGEQIGWGMHFQNPYFLKIVAIILFLLCLYSLEILQIPLFLQLGSGTKQVFWENFVSSIVAAIVAIPCTAPFLGTAAAFAIQGSAWDLAVIFFCISTGFSAPYFAAALMNGNGSISQTKFLSLEKMQKYGMFAKILANTGAAVTLAWILYLLKVHIGFTGIMIIVAIFGASIGFLIRKQMVIALVLLIPIIFVEDINNKKDFRSGDLAKTEDIYDQQSSSNDVLIKAILDGSNGTAKKRVVIINISADWCLTCKYNKINVLNSHEIQELIKEKNVLYIEGDMTQKNDILMKIIKDHGRVGIPFTMVLGPKNNKGIVLSEVPTVEELKGAIERSAQTRKEE